MRTRLRWLYVVASVWVIGATVGVIPAQAAEVNKFERRAAITLVLQGNSPLSVTNYIAGKNLCADLHEMLTEYSRCVQELERTFTFNYGLPGEQFDQAGFNAEGTWSGWVSQFGTGRVTITQIDRQMYRVRWVYTQGSTTADFVLTYRTLDDFDLTYTSSDGDVGTGFLSWSDDGCRLVGYHYSDRNPKNDGFLLLRRC